MSFFRWPAISTSPVTWGVFAFLAGVMIHGGFPFDHTPPVIITGLATLIVIAAFIPTRYRWACVACFAGLMIGLWRFDVTLPSPSNEPRAEFTGRVVDAGQFDVLVRDESTGVVVSVSKRLTVGDRVRVTCARLDLLSHDAKSLFDARKGAWFKCRGNVSATRMSGPSPWDPRPLLATWRTTLTARIMSILPGDTGALLAGMLYGDRGLSQDAAAAFKMAGMTHIIAVSGSNIAMVSALFVPLFLALGYRRKPAILLSGAAIVLFVVFVGAQASVVRAAVMGWLALLARVFGRKASATRLLVIAATCIVIFDPWALSFDAGFALSFLATWGLLSWSRPISERIKWMPEAVGLREAASTTIAATFVTFPYSLWAFGASSLAGLLTNLVAVPLVGFATLWGAIALAVGPNIPILALPARGVLDGMITIARLSELAPFLKITWSLPTWALFAMYTAMLLSTIFSTGRRKNARFERAVGKR